MLLLLLLLAGCGGEGSGGDDGGVEGDRDEAAWVGDVYAAVAAVEEEFGAGQEYFEVTANAQLTNVFVAVDDGTAAIPFVYVDGELADPAPRLDGASGQTFTAAEIDFDQDAVLEGVAAELPDVDVLALSVEGGPGGFVRYVVAAQSAQGGALDIEVARDGQVVAVDLL